MPQLVVELQNEGLGKNLLMEPVAQHCSDLGMDKCLTILWSFPQVPPTALVAVSMKHLMQFQEKKASIVSCQELAPDLGAGFQYMVVKIKC